MFPKINAAGQGLTHCGLVTPYGGMDLGQHWFREWLVAWRHQAITRTNVDLSSIRHSRIHLRAISQEIPQPWILKIDSLKFNYLQFHSNLPGANELNIWAPTEYHPVYHLQRPCRSPLLYGRLLHRPSLVVVGLSVRYETWLLFGVYTGGSSPALNYG